MKQTGKKLGSVFLALCMVLTLMPTVTLAADAETIKGIIEEYSNNLTATVSADGKTVTVTGEEEEAMSILELNLDSHVTVIWKAKLISASEFSRMRLIQLNGSGIFEVADGGQIESKTAAIYVKNGETVGLSVSGGTISAKGVGGDHYAIYTYGDVGVSGGTVSATAGPAISVKGDNSSLTISGGIVRSGTGSAIYATGAASKVTISGGTVSNEASYASCPVIYMNNSDNTADNVTISGTGKVMATASGGNGIKSYGNVTVSGNAEVSAITGGICAQGNVTVIGGKVTAQSTAIMAEGTASVVTVEGGTVSSGSSGKAIDVDGDNAAVIVSGGEVSSIASNGVPIYVTGVNATVTIRGGTVIANLGNAIYIYGDNSHATVSGGSVSSATNVAINAEGRNAVVQVDGGIVFNASTNENCPVISMSHLNNTFDNVIIGGTGKVIAKADGARAIQTCGNVMVEGNAQVCARYVSICAKGTSSTVTVRGGVVFAHGSAIAGNDEVIDLPNNTSGFTAPIGNGMVIAWDEDAGTVQYNIGSTDNIIFLPDTATAGWEKQSDQSGIFYTNNMNTGFIPIDGVTVIKERLAVTRNELSFTDPSTLNYTYDGNSYGIGEVTAKSGVNLGVITVYYTGIGDTSYAKSTTAPTNAGTYQVTVDVAESDDYMPVSGLVLGSYTIAKAAAPSITWPTAAGITYGKSLFDATLSGGSAEYGSFAWTDGTVIPNVTNSGFEVIFTPNVLTLQNYEAITNITSTVHVTVTKASVAGVNKTYSVLMNSAKTYSFDLTSLLPDGVDASQVSKYTCSHTNDDAIFSGTPSVSGTTLTLPVASVATAGLTDTVSIKFTSDNYEISDAVITVETISKMPVTITANMTGGIYNSEPHAYSNAVVTDNTDGSNVTGSVTLEVSYVGTGSTSYSASADAPQNAGSYQLTLSVPDSDTTYTGSQTFPFTIEKRPVTIIADDKCMTVGGSFPALTFTVDGQLSGETALIGEPALNCLADNTTVGNFEITVFMMGTSYTNNYMAADPAYINGTMTVKNPSAGGNSGPATPPATVSGSTATTTATAKTGSDGKATTSVTQSQMSDALKKAQEAAKTNGGTPNVEITVDGASGASSIAVTIPASSMQSLTTGGVGGLTVSSGLGSVTFGEAALRTISGAASGNVTVSVAQADTAALPASVQQTIGTRPVYDFSVTSGSSAISQFGGAVTVSVPYTPAAGEDINAIIIYYINDSGVLETVTNGCYDAATGTVIFSTTHFSSYAVGYNKVSFTDVSDTAWYADPVNFLAARGVTSGTTETTFSPDAMLTRGQFITLLMRAYGIEPDNSSADNFIDAGDTYYTGYLAAAKKLGVSNGVGDNKFAPEQAITRQEMFTLLYNALKVTDRLPEGDSGKALSDFSDSGSISSYAQEAMTYLVKAGMVSGNKGQLNPTDKTTRAQMAQVLYNLLAK